MENFLTYYYGLYIDSIKKINNSYIIVSKTDYFYLIKINNSISEEVFRNNTLYKYKFVINVFNTFISKYEDDDYILLKIDSNYNLNVDFIEMLEFYDRTLINNKDNYKNDWDIKWTNKINSLFLLEKNRVNNDHLNSLLFYYYVSYAEIALKILKYANYNFKISYNDRVCITHRRILYPNINLNFYNPLNQIIDLEVRDVAAFIKSLFYNNKNYIEELSYYLKVRNLSKYSAYMLFVRIIYPSYYFDYYESSYKTYNKDLFVDTKKYESFIKKTYELINSYVQINNFGIF